MMPIITAAVPFILWAISIIIIYYSTFYSNVNHIEESSGYGGYLLTIGIIYALYKAWMLMSGRKNIRISIMSGVGLVLFNIFILSLFYSGLNEVKQSPFISSGASGFTLFFHVLSLLLYPAVLVFLTKGVGSTVAKLFLDSWKEIDARLRIPAEITLGFFIFSLLLLGIGALGYYNLTGLITILLILAGAGFTGHRETIEEILKRHIVLENHKIDGSTEEKINLQVLSIEISFLFFSFLLGVALISIIRPMPIGWDDLGVYMNFPKIMATTGELLKNGGLYAWQLITGTGFLFAYNASQAFYVNQLGGILAVFFLMSILSYAFEQSGKKSLLSLSALLAVFYYAMPMTVFQQAKDMKLDPAYFAFAIAAAGLLLFVVKNFEHTRKKYGLLAIIGILIGFSFSVKVTSLMFIIGSIGLLGYYSLSFSGYTAFFFLFLAFFTKFNLWSVMNVPMPKDQNLVNYLGIILAIVGLGFLAYSIKKHGSKKFYEWVSSSVIFGVFVGIACSPWFIKNIIEVYSYSSNKHIAITSIIGGAPEKNRYDYTQAFSSEEIETKKKMQSESMTSEGKSENEDMGRYFGYENGLNNYLKLPANLTFQKNQGGEFTDITYLFLALVPSLLLFVQGRKKYAFVIGAGSTMLFMLLYYFTEKFGVKLSTFFGQFTLTPELGNIKSYGYAFIIILNLAIVGFIHFLTAETEMNRRLRDIVAFMGIYAFLFVITAFGIVWYGILIYFGFFLIIGFAAQTFLHYDEKDKKDRDTMGVYFTLAFILFIFIITYFIRSSVPHAWNNLKSSYYNEYKYNTLTQEESIFVYRSDYLLPIATLNLKNPNLAYKGITENLKSKEMISFVESTDINSIPIDSLHAFITKYRTTRDPALQNDIKNIGQSIYKKVLYPSKEDENTKGIYRIGTFMTYLINKNNTRYFDDSLLMAFRDFFYEPSPEATIERMKKMNLGYLLVDLNAATIDKDPRHNLTDRFEKLLLTMTANNLKLVSTDNYCLELALEERKKGKLTTNDAFLDIAGTNYESYRGGKTTGRGQKLAQCQLYVIKLINEGRSEEYPLVEQIAQELYTVNATQDMQKIQQIMSKYIGQSWFALFEIIDTPLVTPTPVSTGTGVVSQSGQLQP